MANNLPTNKTMYEKAVKDGLRKPLQRPERMMMPQWWRIDDAQLPQAVMAQCQALAKADYHRLRGYNIYSHLYGGQQGIDPDRINAMTMPGRERMGFNGISSCVDTLIAKLAKAKPRPFFLTSQGDMGKVRKAQKLNQLSDGLFYENKAYSLMPLSMRDAAVRGDRKSVV